MLLVLGSAAHADFYKSVDADGNVVYSDTPTEGAEQVKLPGLSTFEAVKPAPAEKNKDGEDAEAAPKNTPTVYARFSIQQPENDMTIWDNNGSIPVSLALEPALDTENNHTVWVYVDGRAVVKESNSLVQPLSNIDRGTHKIRAEIRSGKKVLKRTRTITVHLKRASTQRATPR